MVRIIYLRDKCIGCGYCVQFAPGRWYIDNNDGKSNLLEAVSKKGFYMVTVPDFEYEMNLEAANSCPSKIIKVQKLG